jgi:hypothetical protein
MSEDAIPHRTDTAERDDAWNEVASFRIANESAIKKHALRCSAKFRAGKFKRVGQDFVDEVLTDIQCMLRAMRVQSKTTMHDQLEPDENTCFTTGVLRAKLDIEMNRIIARIIQNKVQRQPSVGQTLGATR